MKIKIALVGDIAPTKAHRYSLKNNLSELLGTVHIRLGNLEIPIFHGSLIGREKSGPSLYGDENHESIISRFSILSLANNHIMDYGLPGLESTLRICERYHIETVGAGTNLSKAKSPKIIDIGNKKIAILSCCETQFGIATTDCPGVAPISYSIFKQIRDLKNIVDLIIISIHGSLEMSPWPSPKWQELLRSFIDEGATIVHGHHSHVPQGYEKYKNGFIFYGLGNFLVDPKRWKRTKNTLWSIMPIVNISENNITVEIESVVIKKVNNIIEVRLSSKGEKELHIKYLDKVNIAIKDMTLLNEIWQEISIRMYNSYYSILLGHTNTSNSLTIRGKIGYCLKDIKKALSRFNIVVKSSNEYTQKETSLLWLMFACESHRDIISTALGILSGEIPDRRTNQTKLLVDEIMQLNT